MLSDCVFKETRWRALTFPRNFKFRPGVKLDVIATKFQPGGRAEISAQAEIRPVGSAPKILVCRIRVEGFVKTMEQVWASNKIQQHNGDSRLNSRRKSRLIWGKSK